MRSNKSAINRLAPSMMGLALSILERCEKQRLEVVLFVPEGMKQTSFTVETLDKQGSAKTGAQPHNDQVDKVIAEAIAAVPGLAKKGVKQDGLSVSVASEEASTEGEGEEGSGRRRRRSNTHE